MWILPISRHVRAIATNRYFQVPGLRFGAMDMMSLRAWLPRGGSLPPEVWCARHKALLRVLLAHVPAVLIFGLARGFPVWHAVLAAGPVAALWLAARTAERRASQEFLCAAGLITASSVLVHLAAGNTEMHFHFFVMIALLSLYQDWVPFLTA